ncbi:unnamed protein product [Rhizopus stolonifer]
MAERESKDLNELIKKYDEFITLKLKPSLQKELDERDVIFSTQAEYQKLYSQIELMQTNNMKELKLMTIWDYNFMLKHTCKNLQY